MNVPAISDSFAGGGGTSVAFEMVTGRSPDVAINHNTVALALHKANHPLTQHVEDDVWKVGPLAALAGRDLYSHYSPDCRHFSHAKGSAPVSDSVRGLAWVVQRDALRYDNMKMFTLENVREFLDWGPLLPCGTKPDLSRKGETFSLWKESLEALGFVIEWRLINAMHYGAATSRTRLFIVGRRDGQPIVWPLPTHGPGLVPYRTAGEVLDFSIQTPSIFLSPAEAKAGGAKRPLADNTLRRIFRGLKAFVLETDKPYVVNSGDAAFVARQFGRSVGHDLFSPHATITAGGGGKSQLIVGSLVKHYGGNYTSPGLSLKQPISAITTVDHHAVVTGHMVKLRGTCQHGQSLDQPTPTITAGGLHQGVVQCFFVKYYGTANGADLAEPMHTITTKDRMALVEVEAASPPLTEEQRYRAWWIARLLEEFCPDGRESVVPGPRPAAIATAQGILVDIGMRMLTPRELYTAQGFPVDYVIDVDWKGKPISKTDQIRMVGNSVSPPALAAILAANLPVEMLATC